MDLMVPAGGLFSGVQACLTALQRDGQRNRRSFSIVQCGEESRYVVTMRIEERSNPPVKESTTDQTMIDGSC